jgi:crossover junction endodeoxyribonuclease RuvC
MIVGIDPGLAGALAFLDPAISTVETFDIPTHVLARGGKQRREIDIAGLIGILAVRRVDHAFIEAVGAMPGQGLSSTFSFGKTYGIVLGTVVSRNIPISLVAPVKWKRAMGVGRSKDGCRARASQLLPAHADQWRLRRNDGRAEAALIALYGARALGGSAAVPADVFILSTPPLSEPMEMFNNRRDLA